MLENNIALVVGCMPALAAFIRLHNSGGSFFKSMRSKVLGVWSSVKNRTTWDTNHTKGSGIAEKPFARKSRGPKLAQLPADSLEMLGTDERSSQTDVCARPESYAGFAVNMNQELDASSFQNKAWITGVVDVYQQQQQKCGRSSDSAV